MEATEQRFSAQGNRAGDSIEVGVHEAIHLMHMARARKILTLSQVAEYLKVHKNTIYRLVNRKELPAFKVGHDWRFDLELIDRWRVAQE